MIDSAAATGTLVASAMEAAGYHYQAHLLDSLTPAFQGSVGSLLFIIAIATAIINFVVLGQYKLSRWLILGPVLFLAVISARSESSTPRWRFAGVDQNIPGAAVDVYEQAVEESLEGQSVDDITSANVSSLFAGYNNLISSVVQELTKVIASVRKDENLNAKFLIRPQLHGEMTNTISTNEGLNQLLHDGFFYQCGAAMQAAYDVVNPLGGVEHREDKLGRMNRVLTESRATLGNKAMVYLASLKADHGELWKGVPSGSSADSYIQQIKGQEVQLEGRESKVTQAYQQILSEYPGGVFSCQELWKIAYGGFLIEADKQMTDAEDSLAGINLQGEELYSELLKVEGYSSGTGQSDESSNQPAEDEGDGLQDEARALGKFREIIARNMFKNHLESLSTVYPALLSRLSRAGDGIQGATSGGMRDLKENYRHVRRADEWRKKSEAFSHAENLPYYQGVVLFFLSICFPFFALMLLVPGRYTAFMHWFFLWMWVKSWDVGFAVVMCLDDLLFDLLVSTQTAAGSKPDEIFGANLDQALAALANVDPSFGPTIYYTIIGTALSSIPVVTSQMVLGTAAAGSNLIHAGMELQARKTSDGSGQVSTQNAIMNTRGSYNDTIMAMAQTRLEAMKSEGGTPMPFDKFTGSARESAELIWGKTPDQLIGGTIDQLDQNTNLGKFAAQTLQQLGKPSFDAKGWVSQGVLSDENQMNRLNTLWGLNKAASGGGALADEAQKTLALISKTAMDYRQAKVKTITSWSELDAANSLYAQEMAAEAALYGALPIPWQVGTDAYDAQFDQNILSISNLFDWTNRATDAAGRGLGGLSSTPARKP